MSDDLLVWALAGILLAGFAIALAGVLEAMGG